MASVPATPPAARPAVRPKTPETGEPHVLKYVARAERAVESGPLGTVRMVVRVVLVLGATLTCVVVAALIKVVVCPVDPAVGRAWLDRYVVGAWADAVVGGPVLPNRALLRLSGELPRPDHRAGILLANHQLDTDWYYLWAVLRVVGAHGALKIVLLDDMRTVPVFGWCMRLVGFIFVSRRRKRARAQDDVAEIARGVAAVAADRRPAVLLLFPEGTTVNEEARRKCAAYARRAKRPAPDLLLVPRVGGFVAAVRGFASRGVDLRDVLVYDAAVAYAGYRGEVPAWDLGFERRDDVDLPNAAKLFRGADGHHVRVHTVAYRASAVFEDAAYASPAEALKSHEAEAIAQRWLDERWAEKDVLLKTYARDGDFGDVGDCVDVAPPPRLGPFLLLTAAWVGAALGLALAALVASLVLVPLLAVAGLVAAVFAVPFVVCASCALAPLVAAAVAVKAWYPHLLEPPGSRSRRRAFDDAGDDDGSPPTFDPSEVSI